MELFQSLAYHSRNRLQLFISQSTHFINIVSIKVSVKTSYVSMYHANKMFIINVRILKKLKSKYLHPLVGSLESVVSILKKGDRIIVEIIFKFYVHCDEHVKAVFKRHKCKSWHAI